MMQGSLALERSVVPVKRASITSGKISASSQKVKSRIKFLAEAIILQAIEDLFDPLERKKALIFIKGENFSLCAEMAGLSSLEQVRIIRMLANPRSKQSLFGK